MRSQNRDREPEDVDIVPFVPDHRPFSEYLERESIDTVVQCGLVPDRSGIGSTAREADVIATMCIGAAIGHEQARVRSWVLASSSAIYPIASHAALLHRERQPLPRDEELRAASIAEAEDYARDVAHRMPHLNVAILRLQQLVGDEVRGPLASVIARRPAPMPIGFDPAVQLLHLEDATSAMAFAATSELAGVYNVASAGIVHWHEAVRETGHTSFPVLPFGSALFDPVFRFLRLPFIPGDMQGHLRFGHAIDTKKIERSGWKPRHDQSSCLSILRGPE